MRHDEDGTIGNGYELRSDGWIPASLQGRHPTVLVEHDGYAALIDEELAPVILALWRAGIATLGCCQDEGESIADSACEHPEQRRRRDYAIGTASIWFATIADVLAFYTTLANAGPRDRFYARMTQTIAPGSWHADLELCDTFSSPTGLAGCDCDSPSEFKIFGARVRFPRGDIPEIAARLDRHARGERGPHDIPTQEYILQGSEKAT